MIAQGTDTERNEEIINVVEEQAVVRREIVETGKVNIHKIVKQDVITVNIPIFNESYSVEHTPGNGIILDNPPPALRHEGDTMIIPVLQEITVVQKKYQVIEEIRITKKVIESPLTQEVTLRKEEVTVKRT
jgi:uncharacterized protein (TIGR02271 family)